MKGHTILIAKHKDIEDPLVIIQILSVSGNIEINNVLHGMYSRSDTNVRNYFVTEKWLKQGIRSQKKGKERFMLPKWPEMLTFVFDKTLLQQIYMTRFIIVTFAALLLLAGCGNNKQADNMAITVNLRYTGVDGNALKFAEEMISSGTVDAIRAEEGNLRYEYYQSMDDPETILLIDSWVSQEAIDAHHATPMMATIAALREKYDLHMTVERYTSSDMPETDNQFIRK